MIPAPARYQNVNGNPDLVYQSICRVLSERKDLVQWDEFGPNEWLLMGRMAEGDLDLLIPLELVPHKCYPSIALRAGASSLRMRLVPSTVA